jgi:hypothetical protein
MLFKGTVAIHSEYHTKHVKYTMQAKRRAVYIMAGRVHAQTSALKG